MNEEQLKVFNQITSSNSKVMCLLGEAGVGKTFLISKLKEKYKDRVVITATTNKACDVLSSKLGINVKTTHSYCGFYLSYIGLEQQLIRGNKEIPTTEFLIIDEASMLPKKVYETLINSLRVKQILLVGDPYQLKSVSIGIDLNKIEEKYYLTTQVRQSSLSKKTSDYLGHLRESIKAKRFPTFKELSEDIISYESHKDFIKAYKSAKGSKRFLAFSNRVVDKYNFYCNGENRFKLGDMIVLNKPFGGLSNGSLLEITELDEDEDKYIINAGMYVFKLKRKEEEYLKKLQEDYLELRISDEDYAYFNNRVHNPKLIYASTIHKAQGDTIDEVFIDCRDIYANYVKRHNSLSVEEFNRLIYVGISRMRVKAHLFVGEKRDYKELV